MKENSFYQVKKRTLLAIAGIVWIIAGVNVTRMGIIAYNSLEKISVFNLILYIVVFAVFGAMFYKMNQKHSKIIQAYDTPTKPFWYFFDLKSYLIMAFMMSGGIWLRSSGIMPTVSIATFYTGLGIALTFAGLVFCVMYLRYPRS